MPSKTYILINRQDMDFSTLPGEKVFCFDHINGRPDLKHICTKLQSTLDDATEDDKILFNGPGYLIAIAGYVWLTHPNRKVFNMYTYDVATRQYYLNPTLPFEV